MCFGKLFKNKRKVYPFTEFGSKYKLSNVNIAWKQLPDGLNIIYPSSKY